VTVSVEISTVPKKHRSLTLAARNAASGRYRAATVRESVPLFCFCTASEPLTAAGSYKTFTARAAINATVISDIDACTIIITFAQRDNTGTSVGEKAVLELNARNK
jgi:hypothetical protein